MYKHDFNFKHYISTNWEKISCFYGYYLTGKVLLKNITNISKNNIKKRFVYSYTISSAVGHFRAICSKNNIYTTAPI